MVVRATGVPTGAPAFCEGNCVESSGMSIVDRTLNRFAPSVAVTTGSDGSAAFLLLFGMTAGPARLALSVDGESVADTLTFMVTPGQARWVRVLPRDTAVVLGSRYPLRAAVTDQRGNPRAEQPIVAADPPVTISDAREVVGAAYGRARIAASFTAPGVGTLTTESWVSVVPPGRIVANDFPRSSGFVVVNTDGSGRRAYPRPTSLHSATMARWTPDGVRVVFGMDNSAGTPLRLHAMTVADGVRRQIIPSSPALDETWPVVSHDGAWIYFTLRPSGFGGAGIWRVHPDGTGIELVLPSPEFGNYTAAWPSPDGTPLAYLHDQSGAKTLHVRDLVTGADRTIAGMGADVIAWSPTADVIATRGTVGVLVVNADGTGKRQVASSTNRFDEGVAWSPDGRWVVSRGNDLLQLTLVETGLTLPLPFTTGLANPSWAPK